jgi:hypothetical protein
MHSLKHFSPVTLVTAAMLLAPGTGRPQDRKPEPLSEAEILQLHNLLGKAETLLARLEKAGVERGVDHAALQRLKKAGVTDVVLAAVRRAVQPVPANPRSFTLKGQVQRVTCVAVSPDGGTQALGGDGTEAELWDVATGKRRARLPGHPGPVHSLAYAPDGKTLAVGSKQNVVLWDVATGKGKTKLTAESKLTLSPNASVLAEVTLSVFNHACRLNLWGVAEGKKNADGVGAAVRVPGLCPRQPNLRRGHREPGAVVRRRHRREAEKPRPAHGQTALVGHFS